MASDEDFRPMTDAEVRRLRDRLDAEGRKLVFTNGCFDLLHAGHLNRARALGDALVVALNSDASVRELKGPTRPVNTECDRAEVIAALRAVDAVVIFNDKRATALIEAIRPHVYAKGGDYTVDSLHPEERAALDAVGASIHILPLVPGRSTTKTLQRAQGDGGGPRRLRLGVLGSGEGSNLRAILAAIEEGRLDAEIGVAISDQSESRFLQIARAAGVSAIAVDGGSNPRRFAEAAQKELAEHLQRAGVDVVVLIGFMRILKEPTLSLFKDRIVNVHPSLLPRHKGADAPRQALESGDTESGCTVHLVTAEVDGGRILAQASVPILPGDTAETLHARIKVEEHRLLPEVLARWPNVAPSC
jgi:formyltetrahydrofolate-dependent phosphoribosylglycinamide formyltransferase